MTHPSLTLLIVLTGEGGPNEDIDHLAAGARDRGHTPIVLPWTELSVSVDEHGPRLCRDGAPLPIDGIIHQMSTDAMGGLAMLAAVEGNVPQLNRADAVLRSADKFATHVRLVAHGIPTPRTAYCPNDRELAAFADKYGYPVVLKQPDGARGAEVTLAHSPEDLPHKAAQIRGRGHTLLAQRFYPEAAGRVNRVLVIGGRFVSGCEQTGRPGDFRSNGPGDICRPVTLTADEVALAEDAARACGLDLMTADMLRTADGPIIIETNSFPNFGGFHDVDVRQPLLDLIERKHAESVPAIEDLLSA